jgi:hypothetical protein
LINTDAIRKVRLTDFPTGKADLQQEHKSWLDGLASFAAGQPNFYLDIIGFASKTGSVALNERLSKERAAAVQQYLEGKDQRFRYRVRYLEFVGEGGYVAPETDNSPEWRAVEVHFYLAPPRTPAGVKDPRKPLPGGPRFTNWSVAAVFGLQTDIFAGVVAGGNLVLFRKNDPPVEEHWYAALQGGPGYSLAIPNLRKLAEIVQNIITAPSYSGMKLTPVTAVTPFNFGDLDLATCDMASAGGGLIKGYQFARMNVYGKVWYYDRNGLGTYDTETFLSNVNVGGPTLMVGAGASFIGGALFLVY